MKSLLYSSNFWSALLGAIIGGLFVLVGVFLTLYYDSKKEEKQKNELIDSFLNGVYYEIEYFWELDMFKSAMQKLDSISESDKYLVNEIERLMKNKNINKACIDELSKLATNILPKDVFMELFYIRREEYFLIYNNNANLIGKIKDRETIRLIVNAYNKIKGLLDLFDINNDYRGKYIHFLEQCCRTQNYFDMIELLTYMKSLREHAIVLKNSYKEAKEAKDVLFKKLKLYVIDPTP